MNISRIKPVLKAAMIADDSVLMEGKHGIGKSQIVKQYCDENGYFCQPVFMSMMETGDLMGMPSITKVGNSEITTWAEPDWLQHLKEEAWPQNFDLEDLVFQDKDFEKFVKSKL